MSDLTFPVILIVIIGITTLLILLGRKFNWFTSKVDPLQAQRYARLLVAEIKLYDEGKVEVGRRSGTVYEQLKSEIDQARKRYDQRIAAESTGGRDYLHEELITILAEGDINKMGLGYKKAME